MPIIHMDGIHFAARRGGATFISRGDVYGEIRTTQSFGGDDHGRTVVSSVELTVYGDYTQNDITDRSGRVMVTYYFGQHEVYAYTKATAWNGRKWADFAEGGRNAIAELVKDWVIDWVSGSDRGWHAVAEKVFAEDVERRARSKRADADRANAEAARIEAEVMPPIYEGIRP